MTEALVQRKAIELDGKEYVIRPFKGSKGLRAMAIVSQLSGKIRPIMREIGEFQTEYRTTNFLRYTRDLCETRVVEAKAELNRYKVWVDEQNKEDKWENPEQKRVAEGQVAAFESRRDTWQGYLDGPLKDKDYVDIPQSPTTEEVVMAVLPTVYGYAERQVLQAIGLLLVEDSQLKQWRADGDVETPLIQFGEEITDALELDEVADLIITAMEVMGEHYRDKADRLGKRLRNAASKFRKVQEQKEEAMPKVGTVLPKPSIDSSEKTSEPSSTGSPEDMGGTPTEPSTEKTGVTS